MTKRPFKLLRKARQDDGATLVEYEASLWEGPCEAGQIGRYVTTRCRDYWRAGKWLSTSPSVSYYRELERTVNG